MRSKISDKERLLHISDAIESIIDFTHGITYEEYNDDFKLRLALIKLLEIIGEASSGISPQIQEQFSEVDWSVLKSIRNILVHEYFGIDYEVIWNTLTTNIPDLKNQINLILSQL
jgi:uncharacterized protein with HEPN domain